KARDGAKLDDHQTARAKKLAEAFLDHHAASDAAKDAALTIESLQKIIDKIDSGVPLFIWFGGNFDSPSALRRLFGEAHAPQHIQKLIDRLNANQGNAQESERLTNQLTEAVRTELLGRVAKLAIKEHHKYVIRYHEEETHKVGSQAGYLADFFSRE